MPVDPDEANQEVLRQRFLKHRLVPKIVSIEAKAVSDGIGVKPMRIDAPSLAKNTLDANRSIPNNSRQRTLKALTSYSIEFSRQSLLIVSG